MKRLRPIVKSGERIVYGITIPDDIAVFFSGCYFSIERRSTTIILTSGTSIIPTQQEIESYRGEDLRI